MRRLLGLSLLTMFITAAPAAAGPCSGAPSRGCALPFPNDQTQTRVDRSSATGRRLALRRAVMPLNAKGVRIDITEQNRSDGFSPGQPILVSIPGLHTQPAFDRSRITPVNDLAQYARADQPALLIDARTGARWPLYGELDANATVDSQRLLIMRPGRNLQEGHTYVVVLRNLRRASGARIGAPLSFRRALRGHSKLYAPVRRALARARIARRSLYGAWSFTVASTRGLTGRMLAIRNDAFAQLGDRNLADGVLAGRPPAYTITSQVDFTPAQNPLLARTVQGTLTVPCYLDQPGCPPGSRFHYSRSRPDALPTQLPGNTIQAPFSCNIPRAATPAARARISLYGHGLLGSIGELNAGNVQAMSAEHDFVFCATPEIGLAGEDIGNAATLLGDLSNFATLADRLQQGLLDELYLGRLMLHPQGLVANPAFSMAGAPVIDTRHLYYDSNSQGGILGGALTAVAPDFTRAVLGVPGMNFSALLPRSTDFDTFAKIFYPAYPTQSDRTLALAVIQGLWDRGETDGYANHVTTNPLPGTPAHTVLMQAGVGDHQVSNWTAEVEARTIGAAGHMPAFDPGRTLERRPLFGIRPLGAAPSPGSAIVFWDNGPITLPAQVPASATHVGRDPHEDVRSTPAARAQKSAFLQPDGRVVDVCAGAPCHTYLHP